MQQVDVEKWTEEIVELSEYPCAEIVGAVLGIDETVAADLLLEKGIGPDSLRYEMLVGMGKVLGKEVVCVDALIKDHGWFYGRFPTVGQWIKKHDNRAAILKAGNNFFYVVLGELFSGNKFALKKRVTHAIFIR